MLICFVWVSVDRVVYFFNYKLNGNFKMFDIIMLSKNLILVIGNMIYRYVKLILVKMKDKVVLYRIE